MTSNTHMMNSQYNNPEHVTLKELSEFLTVMHNNPNQSDPTPMEHWCLEHNYHPRQFVAFFEEYQRVYSKMTPDERDAHWRKELGMQVSKERKEYYESIGIHTLNAWELPTWTS